MKDSLFQEKIKHAVDYATSDVHPDAFLAQRVLARAQQTSAVHRRKKRLVSAALLIALMLAAVTALALGLQYGILDFAHSRRPNAEIPSDAQDGTLYHLKSVACDHADVHFREAYYDGKTCYIVYDVVPRSQDILLLDCPCDESWYGLTHLEYDRQAAQADRRTVLDRWNAGGYTQAYEIDFDCNASHLGYTVTGVLDEETGIYTGFAEIPFDTFQAERALSLSVRLLPITDMNCEMNGYDYDHAEYAAFDHTFHAADLHGFDVLRSTSILPLPSIGVQIDEVLMILLPQEIQYQIRFSLTDSKRYHALFDQRYENSTITQPPNFRFIQTDPQSGNTRLLREGVSRNKVSYSLDAQSRVQIQTGSLGRSEQFETYTLAFQLGAQDCAPLESVTFSVAPVTAPHPSPAP